MFLSQNIWSGSIVFEGQKMENNSLDIFIAFLRSAVGSCWLFKSDI